VEIDASGLGVLILLQKRARERGLRTRLLNVPGMVERLLDATRLEPLFEVVRL
jgi:anti-anti-sigma factor